MENKKKTKKKETGKTTKQPVKKVQKEIKEKEPVKVVKTEAKEMKPVKVVKTETKDTKPIKDHSKLKLILGVILLILATCLSVYKLKGHKKIDGNKVVSSKEYNIDDKELYKELKKDHALNYILSKADEKFLNKEIEASKEERQYVNDYAKKYEDFIKNYSLYGYSSSTEMLKAQTGVSTIEDLKKIFTMQYKLKEYAKAYIKKSLTKDEMQKYYDDEIKGEIKVSHILIQSKAKASSSDKEKEAAKKEAKEKAEKIIDRLNNGEKFSDLAKKYSDDTTKDKGGDLGFISQKGMVKSFTDAAFKLKKDEYTKKPVESEYGYHIILKTDERAKPKYKDVEDDIINALIKKKMNEDKKILDKARINLREKYNFKINDNDLAKQYKDLIKNINAK